MSIPKNKDEVEQNPRSSYFNLPPLDVSVAFPRATPVSTFPPSVSDYYQFSDLLTVEDQALRMRVRECMEKEIAPIMTEYWEKAKFPFHAIPKLGSLGVAGGTIKGYGCPGLSITASALAMAEVARVDASCSTFILVHSSLAMLTIAFCENALSHSLISTQSMAMAMAAASLPCPSSPFKGNLTRLKPKTCNFTCLTLHSKNKRPSVVVNQAAAPSVVTTSSGARLRLDNLGPQPGSRKKGKRKGRGISAGQGNSCGFGMRGQKSRSGPGVRKGFEGGQMPLYRRIPKLRGIAGGMHAGLPKYVPVNLKDIASAGFQEGEEVSLETLKEKGLINPSGRERRLPLKVLGDGELSVKLNIKARAFSAAAKEKLEAAGCSLTVLPGRKKWVKPSVAKNLARAEEYFAKKRAAAIESEPPSA